MEGTITEHIIFDELLKACFMFEWSNRGSEKEDDDAAHGET